MSSAPCVHTWLLPSHGTIIEGVCQNCGATKMFDNREPGWGNRFVIPRVMWPKPLRDVLRREWPSLREGRWREEE